MKELSSFAPAVLKGRFGADLSFLAPSVFEVQFSWDPNWQLVDIPSESFAISSCERKDEIWKSTCFEVFIMPEGQAHYWEINLSPLRKWNAYQFSSYRTPAPPVLAKNWQLIEMQFSSGRLMAQINYDLPTNLKMKIGITSVLVTKSGEKSYWSLAWPQDSKKSQPDFHDPACYVLERTIK